MPNPLIQTVSAAPPGARTERTRSDHPLEAVQTAFSEVWEAEAAEPPEPEAVSAAIADVSEALDDPNAETDSEMAEVLPGEPALRSEVGAATSEKHGKDPAHFQADGALPAPAPPDTALVNAANAEGPKNPVIPDKTKPMSEVTRANNIPITAQSPNVVHTPLNPGYETSAELRDPTLRDRAFKLEAEADPKAKAKATDVHAPTGMKSVEAPQIVNTRDTRAPLQASAPGTETIASLSAEDASELSLTATRDSTQLTLQRDPRGAPVPPSARAELARAAAGQMSASIATRPGSGTVEIALNPEELGRVSISLNGREDGLVIAIAAERPETLDLMRRHLSVLSSEFQKLGYKEMSFDLGMSGGSQRHQNTRNSGSAFDTGPGSEAPDANLPPRPAAPARGLDLRL